MATQTVETRIFITDKNTQVIIRALDKLALALTDHNHQWADEERGLYEEAIGILTS